jgi:hypothetical protein
MSQDKEIEECQESHYVLHVKKPDRVAARTALFVALTTTLQLAVARDLLKHKIMTNDFLNAKFPDVKKRGISKLLDSPLEINAANGTAIP